jgi:histone acetyltransferase (RNA polymerase elongator complex component)
MARKKQLIIPVFIPFGGCPHKCVFCNQAGITGEDTLPSPGVVKATVERYLSTWEGRWEGKGEGGGRREVAFYGGSFTGLPPALQKSYLECAYGYVLKKRVDALRLSTRPDYIFRGGLALLKDYGVETVELGVQSMSDEVLSLSGRGHGADITVSAVELLRMEGFKVGLQIMPGLPGDTRASIIETARRVAELEPDFVRVYPTLVIRGTPLERMSTDGVYTPWPLEEMVEVCRDLSILFKKAGIPVVRFGLQPTDELEKNIVAGPYHPAFRQLVETR